MVTGYGSNTFGLGHDPFVLPANSLGISGNQGSKIREPCGIPVRFSAGLTWYTLDTERQA